MRCFSTVVLMLQMCVTTTAFAPTTLIEGPSWLKQVAPNDMIPIELSSSLLIAADTNKSLSLGNTDVVVFLIGLIPFTWATVEFWRRIAVGEPFGTGKDSVYIGKDDAPLESRGLRTLDRGAFFVAYILFGIAAGVIGLTLYSVISTSPPPSFE